MSAVRPDNINRNAVHEIVMDRVVVSDQGNVGGMKELTDCLVDSCRVKGRIQPRQCIAQPRFENHFAELCPLGKKLARCNIRPGKDGAAKTCQPGKHGLFEFVFVEHYLNPLISRRFL